MSESNAPRERDAPFEGGPERAHTLIAKFSADTAERLADELRHFADRIDRGEMTVGCIGGPSAGTTYSYRIRPEQTHDVYFRQIDEWLRERALLDGGA